MPSTNEKQNENNYIQAVARRMLLREQKHFLPIDALEIIQSQKDKYYIDTYQYLAETLNDNEYITKLKDFDGAIGFSQKYKKYFCYYNSDLTNAKVNWLCACFIACVELDMLQGEISCYFPCASHDIETFAYTLLAPSFLLEASNITTPGSIIEHCNLPFDKANRLCWKLKKKTCIGASSPSAFEQLLLENFKWFIHSLNENATLV